MTLIFDGNIFLMRAIFIWRKKKFMPLEHFIINQFQKNINQFNPHKIFIVADSGSSWRKEIYPNYKYKRKDMREKYKDIPWTKCYFKFQQLINNLNKYTDIYTLQIPYIEGDDLISFLSRHIHTEIVILTKDRDLLQLATFPNVKVGLLKQKNIEIHNEMPSNLKKNKIFKGDNSDNISKAHNFVEAVRNDILTNLLSLPTIIDETINKKLKENQKKKEVNYKKFKTLYPLKVVDRFIKNLKGGEDDRKRVNME